MENIMLEELSKKAKQKEIAFKTAYSEKNFDEGVKLEREYLQLRMKIIENVNNEIKKRKSIPFFKIREELEKTPIPPKRESGIRKLDEMLLPEEERRFGNIGGFTLGNYIIWAGAKGAGKTSLILKVIANLSVYENVAWFDFEMGRRKADKKINSFEHNDKLLHYYDGDRNLNEIINEIKVLFADGFRNFIIDSKMKIRVSGAKRGYESSSVISSRLSELTSSLEINIHMIDQMSAENTKDSHLGLKGGNDAEYDADYIFYMMKIHKKNEAGQTIRDEAGVPLFDDTRRLLICDKNRVDDDDGFRVEILKSDIFGNTEPFEVIYSEYDENSIAELPII
ncbi:MAG TPA: hypothetical protein EYG93_06155 [Sulfurospirillum arcachonense]|nr:hypothetical protein [Sulfurospirillum arcachonense]